MNKIEYQSNGQPVAICFEDLIEKLGYKRYKPRIGTLGRALLEASRSANRTGSRSKNQRSNNFLKRYWDSYFKKLRQRKRAESERSNHSGLPVGSFNASEVREQRKEQGVNKTNRKYLSTNKKVK